MRSAREAKSWRPTWSGSWPDAATGTITGHSESSILTGLTDPVEAFEVLWEPLGVTDAGNVIPLPQRLRSSAHVGVVGRDVELQSMIDATKRVTDGEGREVLLISGEAGMGKTTLVAEAARAAFDSGACVLSGHCEEDLATPYQLFAEALSHYVLHATDEQLVAHVEAHGSELGRLLPALGSRVPNLPSSKATDSDTERYLLFAAVVGLLVTASSSNRSSWFSTTSSGPTQRACFCCGTSQRPNEPCGCSCSGPIATTSSRRHAPYARRWVFSGARERRQPNRAEWARRSRDRVIARGHCRSPAG